MSLVPELKLGRVKQIALVAVQGSAESRLRCGLNLSKLKRHWGACKRRHRDMSHSLELEILLQRCNAGRRMQLVQDTYTPGWSRAQENELWFAVHLVLVRHKLETAGNEVSGNLIAGLV